MLIMTYDKCTRKEGHALHLLMQSNGIKSSDLTVITSYLYAIYQLLSITCTLTSHDNYVISIMESLN